jgi:uncharacterized protein involved in type VI secretion and phage assembly
VSAPAQGGAGAGGVVIGVVQDLDDPQKLGRVRVELPHLGNQLSAWARLGTLMAGAGRGSLFRPEPRDEVLVAFLQGDPNQPFVIGALWNDQDAPPEGGGTRDNHLRTLRTRSGHVLRFDDTPGAEKIELVACGEKQRIVVDVSGKKISVEADEGEVFVKAAGDVTVDSGGAATVKARGSIKMEAPEITIEASGVLTLKGSQVKIN